MKKILAIGAHPDDIEFYAGGTLAKLVSDGDEVIFMVVTDGRYGGMINIRKQEQDNSAHIIGAKKVIYLDYEDGSLDKNVQKLKQELLNILIKEQPDVVFTFDPQKQYIIHEDFHPDHRTLAVAVLDVILIDYTLPAKVKIKLQRPKIFLYDAYQPNKKIEVSNYLPKKQKALKMFESQNLRSDSFGFERFRVY